jgi:ATP-binding cassette subfamily B protein
LRGRNTFARLIDVVGQPALKCRVDILACLLLEGLGIGLATGGPYLLKVLVDGLAGPRPFLWHLEALVGAFVVTWTGGSLLSSWRNIYSTRINARITKSLTVSAMAGYLNDGRWRVIDSDKVNGLIERLPYSLLVVLDGLVWRTLPLILQLALSLTVIGRLMSWQYVMFFAVLAGLFVVVSWVGLGRQMIVAGRYNDAVATSGALVGDILKNARRVVSNGATQFELSHVEVAYVEREAREVGFAWSMVQLSGAQWAVIGLSLLVLLGFAVDDATRGGLTTGDFILLQAYAIRILAPLAGVGFVLSQTTTAVLNIGEVLDLRGEVRDPSSEVEEGHPVKPAHVEVRDLTFRYADGRGGINGVSVDFLPGSFSVIVGKNGSGKSTLAQLIAGILSPSQGEVTIGGKPLSDIAECDRFRHVLYVPQRTTLLNRDLRSSLLYPPACHSEDYAVRLLREWNFYDGDRQIELDRNVGSQGDSLSGGQLQKLELARLMGIRVPCLILDESTSALDPSSEERIVAQYRCAMASTTTLILVTHRIEIAEAADQVVWVDAGRLVAVEGHGDLMENQRAYRSLWRN